MSDGFILIIGVLILAYAFDFINGFHDAANSIATIVTTRVLTPREAVIWAATFNFIGVLFFNHCVAETIGNQLISVDAMSTGLIASALCAAILWGLLTWYYGLPTSLSQALIGGLIGAGLAQHGFQSVQWHGFFKVLLGIFISPLIGLTFAMGLVFILNHCFRHHDKIRVNRLFKVMQLLSSACLSIAHGANDAQKTMALITALFYSVGWLKGAFHVPLWVAISCNGVMALGTLVGGWRIVRTLGTRITHLNTLRGCGAETGASVAIILATWFGVPVSTTQTVTGAIAGVGLVNGIAGTHWPMLRLIFLSWLVTVPFSAGVGALLMWFF